MQNNANEFEDVTIVSSVSKAGGRFVIGVPEKFRKDVQNFYGKPVRVRLELLV